MADTIYALSTGPGTSAIAIIRLSGPLAFEVVEQLTDKALPQARALVRRNLLDSNRILIDEAMLAVFPAGASFTGEAMAELHCHGGVAVVSALLDVLGDIEGCRIADPGEFTRRALINGRLDLTQAEGLGDLIAADTRLQREQALRVLSGTISARVEAWRSSLIRARALVEATIDWADEEVPEDVSPEVGEIIARVSSECRADLAQSQRAEKLRTGFEVAIIGAPNAGKSTLLNAIAGRDVAIVTDQPGTTRDALEVKTDLDGLPVTFVDTAGLRESSDVIEAEGVRRARMRAASADLRLHLHAADQPDTAGGDLWTDGDLAVWSKADLGTSGEGLQVSALTGQGLRELLDEVHGRLALADGENVGLAHRRQAQAVENAYDALIRAENCLGRSEADLVAEELRSAVGAFDRLTGRLQVEDVLDVVFESFCLGK